ncbi:MAG: formate/nitrite transporter family protein [Oscillospiraceae bacterium]|nr:formate/nitrite transporter family protein [Oscillospiraceae bacterium]
MNSPAEVAKNYIGIGKGKATNGFWKLLILGMLAGAFIGLAGVGATIAPVGVQAAGAGKFLGACVFPVGLAMVLLAGSELFTGNNLIIIPVLTGDIKVTQMLRNWVIVYIGNLIGGILVAALVVYGHVGNLFGGAEGGVAAAMINAANGKVTMSFGDAFLKGIGCNFLVCIAVWISFAAKDVTGKFWGLYMPIMLFVLCGFEHCVANMYYIPCGLFCKALYGVDKPALTWGAFFVKNLIPVTLGNIVGGAGLVGLPYWFVYLREKK